MKTHLDIDGKLVANSMKLGHHRSKREAVESALQHYARRRAGQELLALRGKVRWVGAPDQMHGRTRVNQLKPLVRL